MLSRSEFVRSRDSVGTREILIKRLLKISELRFAEEVKLLHAYDLAERIDLDENDYWILFRGICKEEHCLSNMMEYIKDNSYDLKKIIVDLNFTFIA